MIKVDFHQLWSEFNDWLSYIKLQKHEINNNKQHLNTIGEYGFTNSHSDHIKGPRW